MRFLKETFRYYHKKQRNAEKPSLTDKQMISKLVKHFSSLHYQKKKKAKEIRKERRERGRESERK